MSTTAVVGWFGAGAGSQRNSPQEGSVLLRHGAGTKVPAGGRRAVVVVVNGTPGTMGSPSVGVVVGVSVVCVVGGDEETPTPFAEGVPWPRDAAPSPPPTV